MGRSVRRILPRLLVVSLLAATLLTIPLASAEPGKRVVAKTTSPADLQFFESKGCTVLRVLTYVTSLRCPAAVADALGLEDEIQVFATDLNADKQIGADKVWNAGFTGSGSLIAVLDTGVDYTHIELADSIIKGRDFVNDDNDPLDDNGHGTHVAGIITANGVKANAKGVAPDAFVLAVKVLSASGSGYFSDIVAAIYYVVNGPDGVFGTADDFQADAISMSLGTSPPYVYKKFCDNVLPDMTTAIQYARGKGVVVVSAAGNSGSAGVSLPGCISYSVTVGAVDSTDKVASFSGRGNAVDLTSPGVNIYSTYLNGGYATGSGTSMATPMVSGAIALLKQKNSGLTVDEVENLLFTTAKDLGKVGKDTAYGWGRVDAYKAWINVPSP